MARAGKRNLKFMGVDILDAMGRIVEVHTKHYQSDFLLDAEILRAAAMEQERQDRIFLWMCRESGTWCLRERDVFLEGTREYNTFCFYAEQTREPILAYAVEAAGIAGGIVSGDIYVLDYQRHYEFVKKSAVRPGSVALVYERGERVQAAGEPVMRHRDIGLGKLISMEYQPDSPKKLRELLWNERYRRDHFDDGDMEGYLAGLEHARKQVI